MNVRTFSQLVRSLFSVIWVVYEYMNEHLANDLEMMEEVLVCAHAEFRRKIDDLSGVVLHDERVLFLFCVFAVRVLGPLIGSSTSKGRRRFFFLFLPF